MPVEAMPRSTSGSMSGCLSWWGSTPRWGAFSSMGPGRVCRKREVLHHDGAQVYSNYSYSCQRVPRQSCMWNRVCERALHVWPIESTECLAHNAQNCCLRRSRSFPFLPSCSQPFPGARLLRRRAFVRRGVRAVILTQLAAALRRAASCRAPVFYDRVKTASCGHPRLPVTRTTKAQRCEPRRLVDAPPVPDGLGLSCMQATGVCCRPYPS